MCVTYVLVYILICCKTHTETNYLIIVPNKLIS